MSPMVKTLKKQGNSHALFIDRSILDLLDINANTPLQITTDGRNLLVTPIRKSEHHKKFLAAMEESFEQYGEMYKNLA